jgi:hypothetical protein
MVKMLKYKQLHVVQQNRGPEKQSHNFNNTSGNIHLEYPEIFTSGKIQL